MYPRQIVTDDKTLHILSRVSTRFTHQSYCQNIHYCQILAKMGHSLQIVLVGFELSLNHTGAG